MFFLVPRRGSTGVGRGAPEEFGGGSEVSGKERGKRGGSVSRVDYYSLL